MCTRRDVYTQTRRLIHVTSYVCFVTVQWLVRTLVDDNPGVIVSFTFFFRFCFVLVYTRLLGDVHIDFTRLCADCVLTACCLQ